MNKRISVFVKGTDGSEALAAIRASAILALIDYKSGTLIELSNGTTLSVRDSRHSLVTRLGWIEA